MNLHLDQFRRCAVVALVAALAACAPRVPPAFQHRAWTEGNEWRGSIEIVRQEDGYYLWNYLTAECFDGRQKRDEETDYGNCLARVELRVTDQVQQTPLYSVDFCYDGERVRTRRINGGEQWIRARKSCETTLYRRERDGIDAICIDDSGNPVAGRDGIAMVKLRNVDASRVRLEYRDLDGELEPNGRGFAVAELLYRGPDLAEVKLLDRSERLVEAAVDHYTKGAVIRYEHLEGIDGSPFLARHQLGVDGRTISSEFFDDGEEPAILCDFGVDRNGMILLPQRCHGAQEYATQERPSRASR